LSILPAKIPFLPGDRDKNNKKFVISMIFASYEVNYNFGSLTEN
jgi:hypothetical protein